MSLTWVTSALRVMNQVVAKVADFGLSREVEVEIGGMLPTWRWLAPEVIRLDWMCVDPLFSYDNSGVICLLCCSASSKSYNELADIYSYGMICWELATLNVPFEEYDQDQRELEIKSVSSFCVRLFASVWIGRAFLFILEYLAVRRKRRAHSEYSIAASSGFLAENLRE